MLETNRDITERKAAQEALRRADHQKDEFLAMLAHELRNPLAPIRNAAVLLTREIGADPRLGTLTAPKARASDGAPRSASGCRAWQRRRKAQRTVSLQPHPSAEFSWSMTILMSQTRWPCS